jgi:putative oxidoreductase
MGTSFIRWMFGCDSVGPAVNDWRAAGYTILRIWFGIAIAMHGLGVVFDSSAMESFSGYVGKMGFPAPLLFAYLAKGSEAFGGLLIAAGLLTRISASFLIVTFAVAAFLAHASDPLFMSGPGASKEPAVNFLVFSTAILIMGPGSIALDRLIAPALPKPHH